MTKNKLFINILIWLLKFFVAAGIIYYLFQKIPVQQVSSSLMSANIAYLLPAFGLQGVMYYLNAMQLKIFSQNQKMDFTVWELLRINLITQFYGLFLPGQLSGGLVKWHKLSRKNKMRAQAMACVVLARTVFLLSLAIVGIVSFLIEMPQRSMPILFSLLLGLVGSVLLYLSIISVKVSHAIERLFGGLKFLRIPELVLEKAGKVWRSIKYFHNMSWETSNGALILMIAYHLIGAVSVFFIMRAVGIEMSIVSIVWIRAVVAFLSLFPISISGLGIREGVFVLLLGNYNVPPSDALALSFIIFGTIVFVALIGGVFEAQELLFPKRDEE